MLTVENLNQYYGAAHILRGISLSVKKGECLALLGRNGVGKTTLLKCLMGVLPVASGQVSFDGANITKLTPHERARAGIAYVPQGREIFARLTVEENLLMGMANLPAKRSKVIIACSSCSFSCFNSARILATSIMEYLLNGRKFK